MRHWKTAGLAVAFALAAGSAAWSQAPPAQTTAQIDARVARVLASTPLIDGHNDFPWEVRERWAGKTGAFDMRSDLAHAPAAPGSDSTGGLMTDIPRLKAGHVGGQFWSVWIPVTITGPAAVQTTLEQIDVVKR
ncbi:MAG TPA: membrane dipeptidase, partial [Phenylobacterium sp.]|nr:membrane dipeptidase [Phenylobacterium sp.]